MAAVISKGYSSATNRKQCHGKAMVQGYTTSGYTVAGRRTTITGENYDRHTHEQRHAYPTAQSKLPTFEKTGRENEGFMLNITGINRSLGQTIIPI